MKDLYRLFNIEFAKWLVFIAILCAAAIVAPLVLLHNQVKHYSEYSVTQRFEDVYAASGSQLLFLVFLALVCAYFLKTLYADYWGSKGIYTYLTLPVKRETLYFSRLIAFATCLLLLLASQLLSIRLGYALYASKVASYGEGQFVMHNGYFLAMIRSDFFRLLLPLSFSRLLSSLGLFLSIATGFYYGVLCERSRKRYGFAAILIAWVTAFNAAGYRLHEGQEYGDPGSLYVSSAIMLVLSGWFVWHSLRILKRGAIA